MDAKNFIRRYEVLKNASAETLDEKINVENMWLRLYKDMAYSIRKLSKKQKPQLQPFIKKSLDELKNSSMDVFSVVTKRGKTSFNQLFQKNEAAYFRTGAKGLIEVMLRQENSDMSYQALLNDVKKEEEFRQVTQEEWREKVEKVINQGCENLEGAFRLEKEMMSLYKWWSIRKGKSKSKTSKDVFKRLNECRMELANYMLSEMGYTFKINEYVQKQEQMDVLGNEGLLATIQLLEEKYDVITPMVEEILDKISFIHPRDEFTEVRKMDRHFIFHVGPTNSGKTYHAIEQLKRAKSGAYLAPIRLLALEIQEKMNYSGVPCNLVTGEGEVKVSNAQHQSSTIEMAPFNKDMDVAVIDEVQMIEDPKRGSAWLRAIFGLRAKEIHLCGAPHAIEFIKKLIEECGDTYEINQYERQTSLVLEEEEFLFPHSIRQGDALIVFSKNRVLSVAKELQDAGYKVSMIYGKLPPEARKKQVEMFSRRETDVIVSTDAIGIGLNLPIQRVVFLETVKYDGIEERPLSIQEVKQIAGRAGRRGVYEVGYVNTLDNKEDIRLKLEQSEQVIKKSVLAPTMKLTELEIGTLRQRLIAWKEANLDVEYLEKADIQEQLMLLKQIEKWEHEMDKELLFKALYIPFDSNIRELLFLWMDYVREVKEGKLELTKPKFLGSSMKYLEIYYHQLNLYYNFSRKFRLKMNKGWIHYEKNRITNTINKVMKQNQYKRAI